MWCGLCCANGASAPACSRTQHFVFYLLAMSTTLDGRKCYALASLFACGHRSLGTLHTKKVSTDNSVLTFLLVRRKQPQLNISFYYQIMQFMFLDYTTTEH